MLLANAACKLLVLSSESPISWDHSIWIHLTYLDVWTFSSNRNKFTLGMFIFHGEYRWTKSSLFSLYTDVRVGRGEETYEGFCDLEDGFNSPFFLRPYNLLWWPLLHHAAWMFSKQFGPMTWMLFIKTPTLSGHLIIFVQCWVGSDVSLMCFHHVLCYSLSNFEPSWYAAVPAAAGSVTCCPAPGCSLVTPVGVSHVTWTEAEHPKMGSNDVKWWCLMMFTYNISTAQGGGGSFQK